MNAAGIAKVQNASTQMQFGDRGEVSIPGYPDIALGSPLSAIASLLFSARTLQAKQHVWARGVSTYGEINWAAPALPVGGGASVTNINVSVGGLGLERASATCRVQVDIEPPLGTQVPPSNLMTVTHFGPFSTWKVSAPPFRPRSPLGCCQHAQI